MTTRTGGRASTTILRRWAGRLALLARAERGNAAIEFALATPILLGLLVPVADLGIAFAEQIQVQQAAQAGAQYALLNGYKDGGSHISDAVIAATTLTLLPSDPITNPAPSQSCG